MATIQMERYFAKVADKEERTKQKLKWKNANEDKRLLKKQPSKPKSDSKRDW